MRVERRDAGDRGVQHRRLHLVANVGGVEEGGRSQGIDDRLQPCRRRLAWRCGRRRCCLARWRRLLSPWCLGLGSWSVLSPGSVLGPLSWSMLADAPQDHGLWTGPPWTKNQEPGTKRLPTPSICAEARPALGETGPAAEEILVTGRALLEQPHVFQRLAEDDVQHRAVTCVRHGLHAGARRSTKARSVRASSSRIGRKAAGCLALRRVRDRQRRGGAGSAMPNSARAFCVHARCVSSRAITADGVVEVVVADHAGRCLVALEDGQPFGGEGRVSSGRRLCACWVRLRLFSLQLMQTRVHGIAVRRASAISSPQSRQTP